MNASAVAASPPPYAPRAAALALAHAAAMPCLVLLAGILPGDFAGLARLAVVLSPTCLGGLLVGWANAALLRAMPRTATPWMAFFLAAASPFANGVAAFVLLLVADAFALGGLPDGSLVWTLFALPFAMAHAPWSFVGVALALGALALALVRPLARPAAS
jgi:hypothetical protein